MCLVLKVLLETFFDVTVTLTNKLDCQTSLMFAGTAGAYLSGAALSEILDLPKLST
jgi:hypothetical protein